MARALGAEPQALAAAIPTLRGLPHRLEDLGLVRGHRVWDNGVSTTPDSTEGVLGSLAPGFALLVGGKHKGLPLEGLVERARGRVRRVVAFGQAAQLLAQAFRAGGIEARTAAGVREALHEALSWMEPGEALLFSPACASYDQHLNFKERALAFRRALAEAAEPSASGTPRRGASDGL
jgi:UDP-N-acetylmuramoylalanine--D-glutamate ligase